MPIAAQTRTPASTVSDGSGPELLLTREIAAHYRFASVDGAISFLRQRGVRPICRGRAFLWQRSDVEALFSAKVAQP